MAEEPIPIWAATGSFEDDLDSKEGYDSPEEAVRGGDIPEQFVTILGVQIAGDYARV
jgi:hypothetical protein